MTIACIDFSNDGHRLYLMRSMVNSILHSGHYAICITNDTDKIKEWVDKNSENSQKVIYVSYNYFLPKKIKWNKYLNDISIALHYWQQYNALLKDIEKKHPIKIDVVVFNYIDLFLSCLLPISLQKLFFKFKWAGLYVHTRYMRMYKHLGVQTKKSKITDIDYLFKSDKCIGIGIFDNGIPEQLQFRLDKRVTLMPDISDVSIDNKAYALAVEIKNAANGRTVIGTIGISYYAGIIDMIKLAMESQKKDYFFVCCGQFDEESYQYIPNESDKELLRNFRENPALNCLWKECALKDEFEYNAVFNSFDIIYMMYPEHYTSSNRLTKAAFFKKSVLAPNQYCVGENVTNYQLGEVVEPGNIAEQSEKLDLLVDRINKKQSVPGKNKEYFLLNDENAFQKQLKSLLNI